MVAASQTGPVVVAAFQIDLVGRKAVAVAVEAVEDSGRVVGSRTGKGLMKSQSVVAAFVVAVVGHNHQSQHL